MGKQNAAVLPEPVCAHAIMSRPARPIGMAYFCTGVGLVNLQRRMLAIRPSPRSSCSNVSTCAGTSWPLVSTGMSSYASKLMPVFSLPNTASDCGARGRGRRLGMRRGVSIPARAQRSACMRMRASQRARGSDLRPPQPCGPRPARRGPPSCGAAARCGAFIRSGAAPARGARRACQERGGPSRTPCACMSRGPRRTQVTRGAGDARACHECGAQQPSSPTMRARAARGARGLPGPARRTQKQTDRRENHPGRLQRPTCRWARRQGRGEARGRPHQSHRGHHHRQSHRHSHHDEGHRSRQRRRGRAGRQSPPWGRGQARGRRTRAGPQRGGSQASGAEPWPRRARRARQGRRGRPGGPRPRAGSGAHSAWARPQRPPALPSRPCCRPG